MAQDTSQIRAGLAGAMYMAPLATAFPTATASAWPAGWVDLGILDPDGAPAVSPERETTDVMGWGRLFPVRILKTADGMTWTFTVIQKSGTNLKLSFGGGTITALGGGDYRYSPPAAAFIDEHMFGIEVNDGAIIDRFVLARGFVTETGEIPFKMDEAVKFPLTVRGLEATTGNRWELVSNDPAMAT